jgi:His/Glu/Gln/Arg/opine family amino acid ABC transporter permease subunit
VVLIILILIFSKPDPYLRILLFVRDGIWVTIQVTVITFVLVMIVGLIAGLGRLSKNTFINGLATVYVEIVRGIPLLVQLLFWYFAFPSLIQGQAPKNALLRDFRSIPNSVLFATSSFWQGVDVQGEQLSCVIIDRLPFAVPNDPIVAARVRAIDNDGGNAFIEYQVPSAVIALKQGFGRLIRSLNDRGVLVLLDNRVLKKQYGRIFLNSLPPYRRTSQLEDVEAFFGA